MNRGKGGGGGSGSGGGLKEFWRAVGWGIVVALLVGIFGFGWEMLWSVLAIPGLTILAKALEWCIDEWNHYHGIASA